MPTEILVQSVVFNNDLVGKALKIVGTDKEGRAFDGAFLVKKVEPKQLTVVSFQNENFSVTTVCLCDPETNPNGLVITVL